MECVCCGSAAVTERLERTARGYRRFRCRDCGKQFNERSGGSLNHNCARAGRALPMTKRSMAGAHNWSPRPNPSRLRMALLPTSRTHG
jgi:transposase-like protein